MELVPKYEAMMRPLLAAVEGGKVTALRDVKHDVIKALAVSEEGLAQLNKSGVTTFDNRFGWARTYLNKAGALTIPGPGKVQITQRGLELLKKHSKEILRKDLLGF